MKEFKISNLSRTAQFRHYAVQLLDAPQGYEWGKENPYGTDCSGTVCYPLIRMRYKIRTTADALYRKIFTITVKEEDELDLSKIVSVFYVMQKSWHKLSGELMPKGTVRHVTPVVGRYVVCDADWNRDQIILKTAKEVRIKYENKGAIAVWREINWDAVKKYEGKLYYGVDKELLDLLNPLNNSD